MNGWAWVAVSGVLGALIFLLPGVGSPLVFIFLIPFFYTALRHGISFAQGWMWGALFFGGNLVGILVLLQGHAQGPFRYAAYFLLVTYLAGYAAVWAGGTTALVTFFRVRSLGKKLVVWGATSALYFWVVDHGALVLFGVRQGYTLGNPLIVLASQPLLLYWLPVVGTGGLMGCVVGLQLVVAALMIERRKFFWWAAGVLAMLLGGGVVLGLWQGGDPLPNLTKFGYLNAPQGDHEHPWDVAQEISHKLFDFRQRHPEVSIIFMPESSCKFCLNAYPKIMETWLATTLHDDCALFIGSHRQEGEKLFNCLYCLQKGPIIFPYDKQQPIPFGEYIPYPWNKINKVKDLFLTQRKQFCGGEGGCKIFSLPPPFSFSCVPQICYEFYFSRIEAQKELPLLVATNDSWYAATPYFQKLLLLLARYRAIECGREIFYIAHTGGWWLGKSGELIKLTGST